MSWSAVSSARRHGVPWEERDVGRGRDEVVAPRRRRGLRLAGVHLADGRDGRRRARPDLEIALERELVVRVGDDAARQGELLGEDARRRQARPGGQPAVLDGPPQRLAQRPPLVAAADVQVEQEVGPAGPITIGRSWVYP